MSPQHRREGPARLLLCVTCSAPTRCPRRGGGSSRAQTEGSEPAQSQAAPRPKLALEGRGAMQTRHRSSHEGIVPEEFIDTE